MTFLIDCGHTLSENVALKELVRALWSTRAATLNLHADHVQDCGFACAQDGAAHTTVIWCGVLTFTLFAGAHLRAMLLVSGAN